MVEHDHQLWNGSVQLDPLMVAECLSQGMAAVIPLEIDRMAPGLDQAVYRRDSQDLATLTEEKRGMILQRCRGQ